MAYKRKFEQPNVASDTVADLSKKLLEANTKLKQVEDERKTMLENISHDLRAPLTAIRSTVDYLSQKESKGGLDLADTEVREMLHIIDSRTQTLEALINDLYYLTCIDSGREEFNNKKVPLVQFLEEYFFAIEIDEKYSAYELELDIPEDLDAMVNIDLSKMSRVLDNLFTNARKYSKEGSRIILGAGFNPEDDEAFFFVKDNGQGIPKDALPHIFDRTFRVSGARTPTKEASSGLGLSIAKSIVTGQGGRITCESVYGKGSTFKVYIPRDLL